MSLIGKIISILSGLLALWKTWLNYQERKAKEEATEKEQKRDAAIDDLNGAKTEEEADRASDAIHDNNP